MPLSGSNVGIEFAPAQISPYRSRLFAPPRATAAGIAIETLGGVCVPWNRATGVLSQLRELFPPAIPGAQSANAQASGAGAPGAVTSHVTVAVSPGLGVARSGAPSTSTRAPITRVVLIRDAGSKVGPHPARRSPSKSAEPVAILATVVAAMWVVASLVVFVIVFNTRVFIGFVLVVLIALGFMVLASLEFAADAKAGNERQARDHA
jgi:hypothetical protein